MERKGQREFWRDRIKATERESQGQATAERERKKSSEEGLERRQEVGERKENMATLPLGFPTLHLRPSCVPNLSTLFPLLGCLIFQFPPASSQTPFTLPVMG